MRDLRMWREHLANELYLADHSLPPTEIEYASQRILDQIIFIRVLETHNLQPSFGLLKYLLTYKNVFRNRRVVPFAVLMRALLVDLEEDLNTELLKDIPPAVSALPNSAFEPLIIPDSAVPGVTLFSNSVYNYDFRDLTFDLLGEIYEQYLGHDFVFRNGVVSLLVSRERRDSGGAFYTPAPVVQFTTYLATRAMHLENDPVHLAKMLSSAQFVDVACGSGAFLLAAFKAMQRLQVKYHEMTYEKGELAPIATLPQPGSIIGSELFGVDIDPEAVEIARLNLWLELIRTAAATLNRSTSGKEKLPHLGGHIVAADSIQDANLLPYFDFADRLGIDKNRPVHYIGNPPWGADLSQYLDLSKEYKCYSANNPNSAALFVERIVKALPSGSTAALVLPESMLNREQYSSVRELITSSCTLDAVIRLGEGFFESVFRSVVVVAFTKGTASAAHAANVYIFTKADREKNSSDHLIRKFESERWTISQAVLASENGRGWNIFVTDKDRPVLDKMRSSGLVFRPFIKNRGVELNQAGVAVKCADCGVYVPRARPASPKRKPRQPWDKQCDNCGVKMKNTSQVVALLDQSPTDTPFVSGRDMRRFRIDRIGRISLKASVAVPICPKCGHADALLGPASSGSRVCCKCDETFEVKKVKRRRLGIKYKKPALYSGEKVLVRKTGRGIYAALDSDSYCSQIIYVVRTDGTPYDPAYLLGILSSRALLYYYYKSLGIIEWQSYPHLTLEDLKQFPLPGLDLNNPKDKLLHDQIASEARQLSSSPNSPSSKTDDAVLEVLVRRAFGLTSDDGQIVDEALAFIAQFGPLLAEVDVDGDDEDEDIMGEEVTP